MIAKCWLNEGRLCNETCEAFLSFYIKSPKLQGATALPGIPIIATEEVEAITKCALIAGLWNIGDKMKKSSIIEKKLKPKSKSIKRTKKVRSDVKPIYRERLQKNNEKSESTSKQ